MKFNRHPNWHLHQHVLGSSILPNGHVKVLQTHWHVFGSTTLRGELHSCSRHTQSQVIGSKTLSLSHSLAWHVHKQVCGSLNWPLGHGSVVHSHAQVVEFCTCANGHCRFGHTHSQVSGSWTCSVSVQLMGVQRQRQVSGSWILPSCSHISSGGQIHVQLSSNRLGGSQSDCGQLQSQLTLLNSNGGLQFVGGVKIWRHSHWQLKGLKKFVGGHSNTSSHSQLHVVSLNIWSLVQVCLAFEGQAHWQVRISNSFNPSQTVTFSQPQLQIASMNICRSRHDGRGPRQTQPQPIGSKVCGSIQLVFVPMGHSHEQDAPLFGICDPWQVFVHSQSQVSVENACWEGHWVGSLGHSHAQDVSLNCCATVQFSGTMSPLHSQLHVCGWNILSCDAHIVSLSWQVSCVLAWEWINITYHSSNIYNLLYTCNIQECCSYVSLFNSGVGYNYWKRGRGMKVAYWCQAMCQTHLCTII